MAKAVVKTKQKGKTDGATVVASTDVINVPVIKKAAQSLEVGPSVIENLVHFAEKEEQLSRELAELKPKRYDALGRLTLAFIKAAQNDDQINLAAVFSSDQKAYNAELDKVLIAVGVRHAIMVGNGDKARQRIAYTPEVMKFFPSPKDDGTDPLWAKKNSVRTNFLAQAKKSIMTACGVIDRGITATMDKKAGTLMISGKAVKEVFGRDEVLLDERQKIDTGKVDKEGKAITTQLKAKPSFTQLAQIGAAAHGVQVQPRKDSRTSGTSMAPDKALISLLNSTLQGINKYAGDITDDVKKAMNAVNNAIATKLEA